MALIVVGEVTVNADEALAPKSTAVAPVNPDPVMVMVAPPPAVPLAGVSAPIDTGLVPLLPELPVGDAEPLRLTCGEGAAVVAETRGVIGPVNGDP
jgi:hypothetical protein